MNIAVTFKPGVLDPEAAAIKKSLNAMGFDEVRAVKRVRHIELDLKDGTSQQRIIDMCERLLANPVIESYRVDRGD